MTAPQDPFEKPPAGPPPVPPPPGYGPPPPGYGGWGPPPQSRTNGMAVASLVCGLVGCVYGVPAVLAIVFGFVARSQIKQDPQQGAGMALAGIILGFAWIALGVVLLVLLVVLGSWSTRSGCVSTNGSFC